MRCHNKIFSKPIYCLTLVLFIFGGVFGYGDFARTDQSQGTVDVTFTVPQHGGGGGGEIGGNTAPIISDVTTTVFATAAAVSWSATDDKGIANVSFLYGPDLNYGSSGSVTEAYRAELTGLTPNTLYYFRITVVDVYGLLADYLGTFQTLSNDFAGALTVVAKPEKRVPKAGGNLALPSTLIFYNPAVSQVVATVNVDLSASGTTRLTGLQIPVGNNFEVTLKGQSHLAKKITGVNLTVGQEATLDFTDGGHFDLLAGDVQGSGLKDNFVDILDISAVDARFNSGDSDADLNRDGIVDVLDMSATLVNYNKGGDPLPSL